MNITTKYNIGQKLWTVNKGGPKEVILDFMEIEVVGNENDDYKNIEISIKCHVIEDGKFQSYKENELVGTREELINLL